MIKTVVLVVGMRSPGAQIEGFYTQELTGRERLNCQLSKYIKKKTEHLAIRPVTQILSQKIYLAARFISTGCSRGGILHGARKSRIM